MWDLWPVTACTKRILQLIKSFISQANAILGYVNIDYRKYYFYYFALVRPQFKDCIFFYKTFSISKLFI